MKYSFKGVADYLWLSHVWGGCSDWGAFKCQRLAPDCWEHILSYPTFIIIIIIIIIVIKIIVIVVIFIFIILNANDCWEHILCILSCFHHHHHHDRFHQHHHCQDNCYHLHLHNFNANAWELIAVRILLSCFATLLVLICESQTIHIHI